MTTQSAPKKKAFPICLPLPNWTLSHIRSCLCCVSVCVGHTPYISRLLFPRLFPCIKINVRPLSVAFTSKTHLKCKNHCHSSTLCFGSMDTFSVLARVAILSVFVSLCFVCSFWKFMVVLVGSFFQQIFEYCDQLCVCGGWWPLVIFNQTYRSKWPFRRVCARVMELQTEIFT